MSLSGKTVVFTGTLSMSRSDATIAAKGAGAKVAGGVSAGIDIVVAGPDAVTTSKVVSAKAKGKTIWDEKKFKASLGKTSKVAGKLKVKPTIVKTKVKSVVTGSGKLSGKMICMTGAVSQTRKKMTDLIHIHGGKTTPSINQKTTHVLCVGSGNSSSKYASAISKGVIIIRERQLRQMVGEIKKDKGNVCLAAGHPMKWGVNPSYPGNGYVCNMCGKHLEGKRWVCHGCQDDICGQCRKKR